MSRSKCKSTSNISEFYVIGTGLMRTGTMSLKMALEIIYEKECLHMTTFWKKPQLIKKWTDAFTSKKSKREWEELLKDYCATVDVPSIVFYMEIFEIFPHSKLILTVRDPQKWAKSVQSTIKKHLDFSKKWYTRIIYYLKGFHDIPYLTECSINSTLGININWNDTDDLIQRYNSWMEKIVKSVPQEKLLIFNLNEGWEPICNFLNLPQPAVPFPYVNDRNSFQKRFRKHKKEVKHQLLIFFIGIFMIFILLLLKYSI